MLEVPAGVGSAQQLKISAAIVLEQFDALVPGRLPMLMLVHNNLARFRPVRTHLKVWHKHCKDVHSELFDAYMDVPIYLMLLVSQLNFQRQSR